MGHIDSFPGLVFSRQNASGLVRFRERNMPREELFARSSRIASLLADRGIGHGNLVAIFMDRGLDLLPAMLGTLRSGGAYVPLDPHDPQERIETILRESGVSLVLTQQKYRSLLPASAPALCMDGEELRQPIAAFSGAAISGGSIAYVIYTSGSTGKPKGVEVTHASLVNLMQAMESLLEVSDRDTFVALTTISFDIAALELLLPLAAGADLVIASREEARDPRKLLGLIEKSNPTVLQATPVTWQALLDAGFQSHPGLKMLCGGEAWSRALADKLLAGGGRLWNMYGPTETTIWSSASEVQPDGSPITLGTPVANTYFHLLDEQQQPINGAGAGELCIGGDGVARGYRNRPALTAERFLADPFRPGQRMYRTGDVVRRDPDGSLVYLGRADNQIKLRGFRIELEEIEHAIRNTGLASKCAVALKHDLRNQPRLVAYLEQPAADAQELRARLHRMLPAHMVPSLFVPLTELPLTQNRKIDRKRLPGPDWAAFAHVHDEGLAASADSAETERMVAIWQYIFPEIEIDRNTDFFDIGGQSIDFAELQTLAAEQFGMELTAEDILAAFTPSTLVARIQQASVRQQQSNRQLIAIRSEGDQPPLFLVSQSLIFREVAEHLGDRQPVYAIQMSQEDAGQLGPDPSFEAVAGFYAGVVRRAQPHGPYRLGGWCVAGWLAYEVAKQLRQSGGKVQLLVIVDAWAPGFWRDMSSLQRLLAKATYTISRARLHLGHMPSEGKLQFLVERIKGWLADSPDQNLTDDATAIDQMVDHASHAYQPGSFRGTTLVFRSCEQPSGPFLPLDMGWGALLDDGPTVISLPGDHRQMLSGRAAEMLALRVLAAVPSHG